MSQSINTEFGKNRVQFHNDFRSWWMYETENFITYWYGKGKNVAKTVTQMAEMDHDEIQNIMEHRFNDKIEIIVYVDVTDIKQSNIGLEETFINDNKETKVEGNKMFVYFNGNHADLRKQIRKGIATIYLNSILLGTNLQEIVQNAVLLHLPEWFKTGIVAYVASSWNIEADDELRDLLAREDGKYYDFEKLAEDYPKIAGHSFWNFMDQNYGKSSISNILYLTRINRNTETSFIYVLSQEYEEILIGWQSYYREMYSNEEGKFDTLEGQEMDLKNKPEEPVSILRLSPDGRFLIYAYNNLGKYKVILRDLSNDDEKEIFKYGFKNSFQETDFEYPLIEWNPNGKQVTIIYEDRDDIKLRKYYVSDGDFEEKPLPKKIQRVYSFAYDGPDSYVFSANDNGYSDLFTFQYKTRQFKKITEDFYDDLDATIANVNNKRGVLFSSTRTSNVISKEELDTILPLDKYDIFFLPFGEKEAIRMTFTPGENERYPFLVGSNKITYISDRSGIKNRYVKNINSEENGVANSNYSRNIIRHNSTKDNDYSVFTTYIDGAYQTYLTIVDSEQTSPFVTNFKKESSSSTFIPLRPEEEVKEVITDGLLFQSKFGDPANVPTIASATSKTTINNKLFFDLSIDDKSYKNVEAFNSARAVASRKKFKIIDFSSGFGNEVLFEGLESYIGDDKELLSQPVAIGFKAEIKDLFEDYVVEVGTRYPTTLNGSEYYVTFEDNKRLIDRKYALYRRSKTINEDLTVYPAQSDKRVSYLGLARYKYPFDIYRSIRATGILRFDRLYARATDQFGLERAFEREKRLGLRLEYVFDNTMNQDINIMHGTRYKFFVEALNKFELNVVDGFDLDPSSGFTGVVGGDFRHYIPLTKYSILALRFAGGTSFGSNKMMYYLGGVESAIFGQFNDDIPIPDDESFAFKALAPHLRGFDHNIRNGSSFLLFNSEIRVPIVKHIFGQVRNNFLRNIQLTTFFDAGTAWHGLTPYSEENPLNTVYIEVPTVSVIAKYYRDPLVIGYGIGVRSSLLGYYLKLDYAWGLETREVQSPKIHLSLGMDF